MVVLKKFLIKKDIDLVKDYLNKRIQMDSLNLIKIKDFYIE